MRKTTLLDIPPEEQAQMLAALRRGRYGSLLALQGLFLCAAGRTPTEIAAFLFCSPSSIYRIVRAYQAGTLGFLRHAQEQRVPPTIFRLAPRSSAGAGDHARYGRSPRPTVGVARVGVVPHSP